MLLSRSPSLENLHLPLAAWLWLKIHTKTSRITQICSWKREKCFNSLLKIITVHSLDNNLGDNIILWYFTKTWHVVIFKQFLQCRIWNHISNFFHFLSHYFMYFNHTNTSHQMEAKNSYEIHTSYIKSHFRDFPQYKKVSFFTLNICASKNSYFSTICYLY